jgi:antitoxin component of RelBE/YafQ-DinJ toxin-antitoxin module
MTTTLHIPISKAIKDQAEIVVKKQGYTSLQEVIRVLVFALANGDIRTTFIPTDLTQVLNENQEITLAKREKETRKAIKQGDAHVATSVKEMMSVLENTSRKNE